MNNIPAITNSSSTDRPSALPDSWIEKLFQTFEDWYGSKWAAQYGAFPRQRVKDSWAKELRGFADRGSCIAAALEAQKKNPFPPTLPEFLILCSDAAKRLGDGSPPALPHKLTPEQLEANRKRAADLIATLATSKRMTGSGPFRE